VERIAALSKEVVKVWAGRSTVKYEVKEKRGSRLRENQRENWDDWARERKWSWGRRRDEEEKWSQGRGEISGQGRGDVSRQGRADVSGQSKAALVGSREMVQPLDSWDTWARERKSSWGKKKVGETGSKWNRSENSASAPARHENVATPAQQQDYAEESLPDIQVMNIPAAVPALEVKKICEHFGGLAKFRYYSMLGDLGSRGYKQVIVNYKAAVHHKWAREQLGKEVRKLAAGTTWADVASEFTIKAVVLKVESSAGNGNSGVQVLDLTKDVGHWQGKSRVVGGRTENYLQRISSEVKKTDHQVEEEDKKLLEEVDREAIDSNLTTMMMINEW